MEDTDLYAVLGVKRGVSDAELKSAYRKLAMKYHPDRNPDDDEAEKRFKEVSQAYDILKDPQKRAAYDRFGASAFQNGGGGGRGFGGFDAGAFSDVFEDLFGNFMGGGHTRQRHAPTRGADLKAQLEISLEDAFHGTEADIDVPSSSPCETCNGSGAEPGTEPEVCETCGGQGKIRLQQGFFMIERPCAACRGQGKTIKSPCHNCHGEGRVQETRSLTVNIPPGVEDGNRIRLAGEGEAGLRGAAPGDLYLFVSIAPHPIFKRDGTTLYCRAPISIAKAALGGEFEIPSLDGKTVKVKVPAGAQTGKKFRLQGKGMPQLNSTFRGDMLVEVIIETPVNLSAEQKELLEKFDSLCTDKNSPETKGFFDKIKEFFE